VIKNSPHEILLKKKCFFYPNFCCPQKVTDPAVKSLTLASFLSNGEGGGSSKAKSLSQNPGAFPKRARVPHVLWEGQYGLSMFENTHLLHFCFNKSREQFQNLFIFN